MKNLTVRSNKHLSTLFGLVLAISATTIGCDAATGSDPATMQKADYDQVANALNALVLDESNGQPRAFAGAAQIAKGIVPTDYHVAGEVALAEVHGSEYSLSAVCSDALGRGAICGDDAAEAYVAATWSGEAADLDADWTVVDLDQDVMVLAGNATATATIADDDDAGWRLDYRAKYDVGLDAVTRRVVSGRIDYAITVERPLKTGSTFVAVDARLTFAANGSATLTLDGDHVYQAN